MIGAFVPWHDGPRSPGWVVDGNGCHIWVGKHNGVGYAQVIINGRTHYVYRIRYEREVGPIPDGWDLDHLCDNGRGGCCNPHHCRPATRKANNARGTSPSAQNSRKTHCPKGHPLTEDNVPKHIKGSGHRRCLICKREKQRGEKNAAKCRRWREKVGYRRKAEA